jgi:very-short-patch-repair endonuclease
MLDRSPLPRPLHEHPLPTDRTYRGFVDRCWTEALLILEIDGRAWHSRERDMARDRARDREAARHGWQTLRILDEEVDAHSNDVVDDIVTTYTHRMKQLRRSA